MDCIVLKGATQVPHSSGMRETFLKAWLTSAENGLLVQRTLLHTANQRIIEPRAIGNWEFVNCNTPDYMTGFFIPAVSDNTVIVSNGFDSRTIHAVAAGLGLTLISLSAAWGALNFHEDKEQHSQSLDCLANAYSALDDWLHTKIDETDKHILEDIFWLID